MKHILQNPTVRLWCLSGLTGMVLMAGAMLKESQAHTYSPSPVIASLQVTKPNLQTHSSESINAGQSSTPESNWKQKAKIPAPQEHVKAKKSAKKRMGLAIFFLGILAEKS